MSRKNLRIALVWNGNVMQERLLRTPQDFIVGTSRNAAFVVPIDGDEHLLFSPSGEDAYTLTPLKEMGGRVSVKGEDKDVSSFGGPITVSEGDWGVLTMGDLSIFFQWVDPAGVIAGASPFTTIDWNVIAALTASAFVQLAFLLIATLLFDPTADRGDFDLADRFVRILVADLPDEMIEEDEDDDESQAEAVAGEEGEFGDPDDEEETELPDHDAELVDDFVEPELATAVQEMLTGEMARIFDTDSMADSFLNDFATAGEGDAFVTGRGALGMGAGGTGSGGGGTGFGRAGGVGSLDTGGGQGRGAGMGRREARAPSARMDRGSPNVSGFLTREQIERVVRRHSRGIRFCYERELQTDPTLGGRITANWTVGLDGRVQRQSVVGNTMGNRNVESCILREVSRMRFDQPDGGMVEVSYPFTFRAAD